MGYDGIDNSVSDKSLFILGEGIKDGKEVRK